MLACCLLARARVSPRRCVRLEGAQAGRLPLSAGPGLKCGRSCCAQHDLCPNGTRNIVIRPHLGSAAGARAVVAAPLGDVIVGVVLVLSVQGPAELQTPARLLRPFAQ